MVSPYDVEQAPDECPPEGCNGHLKKCPYCQELVCERCLLEQGACWPCVEVDEEAAMIAEMDVWLEPTGDNCDDCGEMIVVYRQCLPSYSEPFCIGCAEK